METTEFGKWRSLFWPIHRFEIRKFIPMLLIFFFIVFNYNILRAFKDSLVVTAKESGAEAIPFIKVWAILPMALLFTYLFTKLSSRFTREKVFYIMMSIFLGFFLLFTLILYPFRESLHPHELADQLQTLLPSGFKGLIAIFRNWTFTLFYIMSDLWSTAIMSVLFWSFANEVTTVPEARRYYGLFATGANLSAIISGVLLSVYCSGQFFFDFIPYGNGGWEQSVLVLNCIVLLNGAITMLLFRHLHKKILPKENILREEEIRGRPKMSLRQSFITLAQSKYLLCIALIVLCYNLGINLIEIVWKNQLKQLYPEPSAYNAYMGHILTATGAIATVISLLTVAILRRFSWTGAALIPPAIVLITGTCFFAFILFPDNPLPFLSSLSPLFLSVTFGSMQNCFARASKYTLFDSTKEMAFIPLDRDQKLKGKAAIDGVGSRLGKSGGSIVHQAFLFLFGSLSASAPYISAIFLFVTVLWVFSVTSLGKRFEAITSKKLPVS